MAVKSGGSNASFDLLAAETSGDDRGLSHRPVTGTAHDNGELDGGKPIITRRKSRGSKKKRKRKKEAVDFPGIQLGPVRVYDGKKEEVSRFRNGVAVFERRSVVETVCESTFVEDGVSDRMQVSCVSSVELRQRNVNGGSACDENSVEERSTRESSTGLWKAESNRSVEKLDKNGSLDWKKVMAEHPDLVGEVSSAERLPFRYFMGEIYGGNTLRSTISVGNEKKRQRVYNTMFYVPLRCERLIVAGFFVCLDSFLSMLTIMPTRILLTLWRILNTRQFCWLDAAELSDLGCFIVLAAGVTTLQLTDISLIYHIIRGQGTIKLYVLYNVLEIFDKLLQSFGEDVLQVLFSSAEGLATCSTDSMSFELMRFILDQTIAAVAFIAHSFILLTQAITLSTCIISHNNALMALLISSNFAEIKSSVFKRVSKDNLHSLVYYDIIERFHITAFLLFVLAQNILEAEGSWFGSFLCNALLVYICEVFTDTIKHSFLAKFNEIKPDAYSEFLEDLCKQTLNTQSEETSKNLTFIPLAPVCVVIRVLTPIYATLLPYGPFPWRLFWIVFWSCLTFLILAICKILVGLSLNGLATWYINQRLERKQHID